MYVEHTLYVDIHTNSKQHTRRHTYIYSGHTCKASNRTQRTCTHIFSTTNSVCEDILSEMLVLLCCRVTAGCNTFRQIVYERQITLIIYLYIRTLK